MSKKETHTLLFHGKETSKLLFHRDKNLIFQIQRDTFTIMVRTKDKNK